MKGKRQNQQNRYTCIINTPVGKLGVMLGSNGIARVEFLKASVPLILPRNIKERRVIVKIKQYFLDPYCKFKLLINIEGTPLQRKIWRALQKIPVGKVRTYGELAKILKTSPRVIGNACRLNPLPIIIPCHRVIAANGLGGYAGRSLKNLKIKKWLLAHENKNTAI